MFTIQSNNLLSQNNSFPPNNTHRILFILRELWGENGVTSHLKNLAEGLTRQGFKVAIVSQLASNLEGAYEQAIQAVEAFRASGISYYIISLPESSAFVRHPQQTMQSLKKLNAVVQDFKPDVIHCHSLSMVLYIHLVSAWHKIPFVSTCHTEPSPGIWKIKLIRLLHHFFPSLLGHRLIAISSKVRYIFEELLQCPSQNIRLIYHGVNDEYFHQPSPEDHANARSVFNLSSLHKVVCLIGRLDPLKRHDILLSALAILQSQGLAVTALCAGKGYTDEQQKIQEFAIEFGVSEYVIFLGMTDVRQVLWASDVLVLLSEKEAFSLVIPEAMFCGVVPIRTPAGGSDDQIEHGINGFITPFNDPENLAHYLKLVLQDNVLRIQMAEASVKIAQEKFRLDQMIEKTISVYQELASISLRDH